MLKGVDNAILNKFGVKGEGGVDLYDLDPFIGTNTGQISPLNAAIQRKNMYFDLDSTIIGTFWDTDPNAEDVTAMLPLTDLTKGYEEVVGGDHQIVGGQNIRLHVDGEDIKL